MAQTGIKIFFKTSINPTEAAESDDSDSSETLKDVTVGSKELKYFENLLKNREDIKKRQRFCLEKHAGKNELILEEIKKLSTESSLPNQPTTSKRIEPEFKKQKLSSAGQKMLEMLQTSSSVDRAIEDEISAYINVEVINTEPLDWWQQNKNIFPNVSKLAEYYFGIPATSASSEQAFSSAGNCINSKRSNLNPQTLKKQLLVHDNRATVEPLLTKTL